MRQPTTKHEAVRASLNALEASKSVSMDDGHAQLAATQAVAYAVLALSLYGVPVLDLADKGTPVEL